VLFNKLDKKLTEMSSTNKNVKNAFDALSNDEHDDHIDDVIDSQNDETKESDSDTNVQTRTYSIPKSQPLEDKAKKSWASLISATASEVKTPGESPDKQVVFTTMPSSVTQSNDADETDGGGWQSVSRTSKSKGRGQYTPQRGNQNGNGNRNQRNYNKYHSNSNSNSNSNYDVPKRQMNIPTSRIDEADKTKSSDSIEKTETVPASPSYASISAKKIDAIQPQTQSYSDRRSRTNDTKSGSADNSGVAKKTFDAKPVQRQGNLNLPTYYGIRTNQNEFEIPQCEYDWVKRVGGLEKSVTIEHMFKGAMACAISYFDNYMTKNKFFHGKIALDERIQEEIIELICMQTTAILFHRLIKSDSVEIVKTVLSNVPLYRTVSGNPTERTGNGSKESNGASIYMKVRSKFIDDLRITHKKTTTTYTDEQIEEARQRVARTEQKWQKYILQSVWNGNNPIHDCLYYGAKSSFQHLLCHYFETSMHKELNNMMLVRNIQNETHLNIVENGKKACDGQGSLNIIRRKQYKECEELYNKTVETLLKYMNRTLEDEANNILGNLLGSEESKSNNVDDATNDSEQIDNPFSPTNGASANDESGSESDADGDNVNIYSLISNGNVEGMANHINRCAKKSRYDIIHKTFEVWRDTAAADSKGELADYISDVEFMTEQAIQKMNAHFAKNDNTSCQNDSNSA
jgi:hypothetical protein